MREPRCIEVGSGVIVHEGAWLLVLRALPGITPRLVFGDGVLLGRGAQVACVREVVLEENVATSDDVFISDCYIDYRDPWTPILSQPMSSAGSVRIGAGSYLGAGSMILNGVTVGPHAYVGEGAVVTRDIPTGGVVYGSPGRLL